ncbi:MAG: M14 family metallocarboxypeptidase [Puniceicoccaceae bacterium]
MTSGRETGRRECRTGDLFSVPGYLDAVRSLAAGAGFSVRTFGEAGGFALPVLTRGGPGRDRLYVSAGVHGDEPAGPLGIRCALEKGWFSRDFGWVVFPVINPTGLVRGTRETAEGIDLNRDYRRLAARESRLHRAFLAESGWSFRASLGLHEDWEADGAYLYEHNPDRRANPCEALLGVLEDICGLQKGEEIDGWAVAREGLIHPPSVPEIRENWPEQIYMLEAHTRMSYTVETPSECALENRVRAAAAAVRAFGDPANWVSPRVPGLDGR